MVNLSLLYAEDDKALQNQYQKLFLKFFKDVYIANDGEEALFLYTLHKPKMMIFDINMPKIDGLTLTTMIRENDKESKILLLTASNHTSNLLSAIPLQLVDYLIKPVKVDTLMTILHKTTQEILYASLKKINSFHRYDFATQKLFEYQNGTSKEIDLTKNEIKIIELFLNTQKPVVSIERICDAIWDDYSFSMTRLRSLINRLNGKLTHKLIISHYALGYKFYNDQFEIV